MGSLQQAPFSSMEIILYQTDVPPRGLSPNRVHGIEVRSTFAIRFYRIYDMGNEIDLNRLGEALGSVHATTRSTFTRVKSKSISMDAPPLLVRLPQAQVTVEGREVSLSVNARIYDIGAVSICFILEDLQAPAASLRKRLSALQARTGLNSSLP